MTALVFNLCCFIAGLVAGAGWRRPRNRPPPVWRARAASARDHLLAKLREEERRVRPEEARN